MPNIREKRKNGSRMTGQPLQWLSGRTQLCIARTYKVNECHLSQTIPSLRLVLPCVILLETRCYAQVHMAVIALELTSLTVN
jgi:hypothetical protein